MYTLGCSITNASSFLATDTKTWYLSGAAPAGGPAFTWTWTNVDGSLGHSVYVTVSRNGTASNTSATSQGLP